MDVTCRAEGGGGPGAGIPSSAWTLAGYLPDYPEQPGEQHAKNNHQEKDANDGRGKGEPGAARTQPD